MNPNYPIYVISKGRGDKGQGDVCSTAKELISMKVPFSLVVEYKEYNEYKHLDCDILKLPFSDLKQGSIPARNWVWNHSIDRGDFRHWILDDNISQFLRLNRNERIRVTSGTIFKCAEDFVDRYENIAIAGFNYRSFCVPTQKLPPFYLNTRIYSCILIRNDIRYMWRGKYNEDTDLCLRALKDGWCTVLFNAFLIKKLDTMKIRGGNTDNVYIDGDNRLKFAESLVNQHPDLTKIVWKFNRWHHSVNYTLFKNNIFKKNKLKLKDGLSFKNEINNYGMKLIDFKEE